MEEEYQGMEEADLEDEELESLEQDKTPKKKLVTKLKASKSFRKPVAKPQEVIKKRYGVFATLKELELWIGKQGKLLLKEIWQHWKFWQRF